MVITKNPSEATPNLVLIGGGSGTSSLIESLVDHNVELTAIVTTTDNGGSTGRLRDQYSGLIGLGDIRQCLRALSGDEGKAALLDRRTSNGHALGNLQLVNRAMELGGVEFVEAAIEEVGKELAIRGRVIPATQDCSQLHLSFPSDKQSITGEYQISNYNNSILSNLGRLSLLPEACINPLAERAIWEADANIISPGNFYGSIIPPLLIKGMREALQSSKGQLIMVSNILNSMTTRGFSVSHYIGASSTYWAQARPGHCKFPLQQRYRAN